MKTNKKADKVEQYKRELLKTLRAEIKQYEKEHTAHLNSAGDRARGSCLLCNMYWGVEMVLKQTVNLIKGKGFEHRIVE